VIAKIDSLASPLLDEPAQAVPAYLKELASRPRKRSSSLFSTSSTASSILDFYHRLTPKAQPSITTTPSPLHKYGAHNGQIACGSFVTNPTAAATTLRLFLTPDLYDGYEDLPDVQSFHTSRGRQRCAKHAPVSAEQLLHNQTKGPTPPFITRSLSISSSRTASRSPSPPRSTNRRRHSRSRVPDSGLHVVSGSAAVTNLHPILARLERDSKFCKATVRCSTCGKAGVNYPICGRCGDRWCSRECRIGQAKRHACRSAA